MSLRNLLSNNKDKLKRIFPGMRPEWFFKLIKGIEDIELNNNYNGFRKSLIALLRKPPEIDFLGNMQQARCGANGCVYYNARYVFPGNRMRYVAVKTFKNMDVEEKKVLPAVFVEVLIQIILSFKNKENPHLKVPEPIFFGKFKNEWVFVMQQIKNTKMFYELLQGPNDMYAYLLRLLNGLFKIQQTFNFMHRDLHGKNILFDTKNNELYMIDFGYSCIGVRNNNHLYSFTSENAVTCHNDSHDVCMCLISLYFILPTKRPQLFKLVSEICAAYRTQKPFLPKLESNNNTDVQYPSFRYNDYTKPVFHWWYLYGLTNIRTIYTPKYLSTIKCLNPLNKYFQKLKF